MRKEAASPHWMCSGLFLLKRKDGREDGPQAVTIALSVFQTFFPTLSQHADKKTHCWLLSLGVVEADLLFLSSALGIIATMPMDLGHTYGSNMGL